MSKSTVNQVVQRAISDAAFRRQLQSDPHKALKGFDLSADERSAITAGDPARLTALGVDQRMSKAFSLGALSDASKVVVGDATGAGGSATFIDDGSAGGAGSAAIVSGSLDASSALVAPGDNYISAGAIDSDPSLSTASATGDAGESAAARHLRMVEQDLNAPSAESADTGAPDDGGTQVIQQDQPTDY
ncbi:MAG: Os1348 family NHLP clan protein [Chloroflexota bacterium]